MRFSNRLLDIIFKYLQRKENFLERKDLYLWYETLISDSKPLNKRDIIKLHRAGKKRLFTEIGGTLIERPALSPMWYGIAATILLSLVTYFSVFYINHRDDFLPVNAADIQRLDSEYGKATMTLSTGEVVKLDTLEDMDTAKLGTGTISNNGSGALVYKAGNSLTAGHAIGVLQTGRASQYNIELSDGTRVWLNAKSRLSFPEKFGVGDRVVRLDGEAYFEVKKTAQRSKFFVESNGQSIEVLGTKFNVNNYLPGSIITTLAQGSVRLTPDKASLSPIMLKPNQQVILTTDDLIRHDVDVSRVIAWKDGYFSFDGNNTQEILLEIGEWYGIDVVFNKSVKKVEYTGKIAKNIGLSRLLMLLKYQDIDVKAFKDKNNQLKIIVN